MGLALASTAVLLGSADLGLMAGFGASGHRFPDWPAAWVAIAIGIVVVGALCRAAEPHVHPQEWAAWASHMAGKSGWDILLGRHILRLREPR